MLGKGMSPPDGPQEARMADEALLGVVLRGDADRADAWSELVARLTPSLYGVARSFRLDAGTCDDLVQTAWLRLIERADQLREPGAVRPWLCTIVRNEARKLVTRTRTVPVGDGWERQPAGRSEAPDLPIIEAEQATALRTAFAKLDADCRQLIQLTMIDPPLSYDEIAATVGRPRGSLGPTRRRCLDRLRALLPEGLDHP